jgi:hypothetical protein
MSEPLIKQLDLKAEYWMDHSEIGEEYRKGLYSLARIFAKAQDPDKIYALLRDAALRAYVHGHFNAMSDDF